MAKPFTSKTIDVTANNPNSTNPAQPDPVPITFNEPPPGAGLPIGPPPGATDAVPGQPNVKKGK